MTGNRGLLIGVDAAATAGGGITQLRGILAAGDARRYGIERLRIWASYRLLDQLPEKPWVEGVSLPEIEGPLWRRLLWQRFQLPKLAAECDLLWSPGGFVPFRFSPLVTMAQNSLLYDLPEMHRYGWTPTRLRLELLRWSQLRSIRRADGVLFLTEWGEKLVRDAVPLSGITAISPHGIEPSFWLPARPQRPISEYSTGRPFKLVYVSVIDFYKHQWHVARAVAELRSAGLPVEVTFAGPAHPPALRRLVRELDALDPKRDFLHYVGSVPYPQLPALYRDSDVCVFASTCENLPNVLLEAMATGIPIACTDRSPMRDVLQDAGAYFDAESSASIAAAIRRLIEDPGLRDRCARAARSLAEPYTWERCADETLSFLARVAKSAPRRG